MSKTLDKQGEHLHREVDNVIKELKNEVDEMTRTYLMDVNKQAENIKCSLSEITQIISDVKKLLNSNDVSHVSSYKSNIAKFKLFLPKLKVPFLSLSSQKINKQQILNQFGSLSVGSKQNERMLERYIEQEYDYPDMNYSMEGQRVESFQRRELNVTRMRRSKHDRVQRKGQSKKKPEMQSLQYNHEVRPRRSYVQDPPLSESYPDPTTRTGAVYVNSFPKKAFGRVRLFPQNRAMVYIKQV